MSVELDLTRKAVNLVWDTSVATGGTVDLRCTNPNNLEDVSTRDGITNDGYAVVTFPADYAGECNVTVTGSDGGVDTGTILVGETEE
jgi:hypothetical protein